MSVLIKGIDMPKEPWDCPCHNGETGQCKVINIGCYDYIPKCCPLVEVPTPHGRLVDIDKLDEDKMESDNPIMYMTVNAVYIEAVSLDYIDSLPTIIEAEVEE